MTAVRYVVPEISCDHCKHAIEQAVAQLDGVELVTVTVEDKSVTVTGTMSDRAVRDAIAEAGYEEIRLLGSA